MSRHGTRSAVLTVRGARPGSPLRVLCKCVSLPEPCFVTLHQARRSQPGSSAWTRRPRVQHAGLRVVRRRPWSETQPAGLQSGSMSPVLGSANGRAFTHTLTLAPSALRGCFRTCRSGCRRGILTCAACSGCWPAGRAEHARECTHSVAPVGPSRAAYRATSVVAFRPRRHLPCLRPRR